MQPNLEKDTYSIAPGSNSSLLSEHRFRVGMWGRRDPYREDVLVAQAVALSLLLSDADRKENESESDPGFTLTEEGLLVSKAKVVDNRLPVLVTGLWKGLNKSVLDTAIYRQQPAVAFLPRPLFQRKVIDASHPRVPKDLRNTFNFVQDLGAIEERDPDEVYHSVVVEGGGAVLSSFQREAYVTSAENVEKFISTTVSWCDCLLPFGLGPASNKDKSTPKPPQTVDGREKRSAIYFATLEALKQGKPVFVSTLANDVPWVERHIKPLAPPFLLFYEVEQELKHILSSLQDMVKGK